MFRIPARSVYTSATRYFTKNKLPDPLELETGLYRKEILARLAGDKDPYDVLARKREKGTKEEPNLITSAYDSRMIGCICEEDSHTVLWMWLHKDEPKRCFCGHWFKLVYKPPFFDYSIPQ